jgi:hypothetical protein
MEEEINEDDTLYARHEKTWQKNEMCLAFTPIDNHPGKWIRASVIKKLDGDLYKIFLIDYATTVSILHRNLTEISEKFTNIPPYAVNVHLAKCSPPGNAKSWPVSTTEEFGNLLKNYDEYSISVMGDADERGSIPVLLHGVFDKNPHKKYHNIILYLYDKGFVGTTMKFNDETVKEVERKFRPCDLKPVDESAEISLAEHFNETLEAQELRDILQKEMDEKVNADDYIILDCNVVMNVQPKRIRSWIPCNVPALGKRFFGYPSHVDDDGIIYFQTREEMELLTEMNAKISNLYSDPEFVGNMSKQPHFKPGDCVIALYPSDLSE